jgi:hypothetical membrane protein
MRELMRRSGSGSGNDRRIVASALGGVIGPAAFVGAWVAGAIRTPGYSSVDTAISRLAAVGASTRPLMTAGMITFGVALPVFSRALREEFGDAVAAAAIVAGVGTLAVAALPLDVSHSVDVAHGVAATIAYLGTAGMPALALGTLRRRGSDSAATLSVVIAAVSAASLAATTVGPAHGFFQRLGLTVADVWMVAVALTLLRRPSRH